MWENKLPRYTYYCKECEHVFETGHAMGENLTHCRSCDTLDTLRRVPAAINIKKQRISSIKKKPGTKVKAFIKGAREDLKLEKTKLKGEKYKK